MAKTIKSSFHVQRYKTNSIWIIGSVLGAAIVVLVLTLINLNAASKPPASPSAFNAGRILGKAAAPVTIDLYSDFQCPICRRAEQTMRQIAPAYIDTGKVKVVYHNFAFIGPESEWAAQAAECASEQGKFWEYAYVL